jgi:protease I
MADRLNSAVVAFLAAGQGAERAQLAHPWQAVLARGGQPVLVSPATGQIELRQGFEPSGSMPVDVELGRASPADFAGLVLPGGLANADELRSNPAAVRFVRAFFTAGLPVAALCRAPWVLIDAGVVPGRRVTSWPGIQADLRHAGAHWINDGVVICEQGPNVLVTGRAQADLPEFCYQFTRRFGASG